MNRKKLYYLLPVLGTGFCILYILAATKDVVYSDYIRLINSYLPDVWDPKAFFVPDLLTRMPVNYLERIINVTCFGYSTTFEMILGVLSLGAAGAVLAGYCRDREIGMGWYVVLMVVFFSLNKWEMLTNGTGWCHFLAFAGFYLHYRIWDRVWRRQEKVPDHADEKPGEPRQDCRDRRWLKFLPWLLILGTAGPYCGAYAAILVLTYGFCFFLDWRRKHRPDFRHLVYLGHVLAPMALYLLSSSFAVEEHAGATGRALSQVLGDNRSLFPKFLLKGLSTMVVGKEPMLDFLERLDRGMALCYLAGLVVLAGYLLALWLQLRQRLYETTLLPLMFLLWGGLNHLLVLAARWIFENSDYGMSSRYALQYQVGILGMLLTFALVWKQVREKEGAAVPKKTALRAELAAAAAVSLVIFAGNGYTILKEIEKAPYRRQYAERVEYAVSHYQETADEELENLLQYHHGPEKIRSALRILEEHNWNVYGGQ